MSSIDVDALRGAKTETSTKALCYKTVDVFAGLCDRKLWLKDAKDGIPKTNGYLIEVPFGHDDAYQYCEHEISHILFKSDFLAKQQFIQEYSKKIGEVAKKHGAPVNERMLRAGLDAIIGVLDDERVISLWGLLYRGSEAIMRRMKHDEAIPSLARAHDDFITLFLCVASGNDVPDGKLSRFVPYMLEALRKVHQRDYFGCLVAAKWLVVQLVSELVRESQGEDPPPMPGFRLGSSMGGAFGSQDGSDGLQEPEENDGPPKMPWEDDGSQEGSQGAGGGKGDDEGEGSGGGGSEAWEPPEVQSSIEARSKAMQDVVNGMTIAPKTVTGEVTESKYKRRGEQQQADRIAKSALDADVKDTGKLEMVLERSAGQMQRIVDRARHAIRNAPNHDDSIRRDAYAKVIFTDVLPSPHRDPHVAFDLAKDADTVKRLRATFTRVIGRRINRLEEAGSQIDIPALIERRMTNEPIPVFRVDAFGRGFQALVLVDRSTSMQGRRTTQAERACKIISQALDFPFVDRKVWGFQSLKDGEVNITRFKPGQELFESDAAMVGGVTPLHTAIRVGVRELEDGTDRKHLFVISDGYPVYSRADGASFGTKTLMGFVKQNVMDARQKGIGVTGVLIGKDIASKSMAFMFGPSKYWRVMSEDTFANDLVGLVSGAFVEYLRGR
jgi:hypothetical protein